MRCPHLVPGPVTMMRVQVEPSHSHVSSSVGPDQPPNNTSRPRIMSNARSKQQRPGGPTLVIRFQLLPSQSQVSLKNWIDESRPPHSTTRPRAKSKVMARPSRGAGLVAGADRVQVTP